MIANRQRRVSLDEDDLGAFAARAAAALHLFPDSFTVALVSDRGIAGLNRRYRHTAQSTDVLSFPLHQGAKGNGYLGDIVISAETARRNARRCGHGTAEEVKLLILHGLLHLLGCDHESDRGEMTRREHRLRRRLGLE